MFALIISVILSSAAFSVGWSPDNNPFNMGKDLETALSQLPAQGQFKDQRLGWPGSHWANYVGGIAHRWSAGNPENFTYKRHSLIELKTLEPHEIDVLSPAEKFDIYNRNYNYPTVKSVLSRLSPNESQWHGICHGYAPAALNHPEPASVTLVNPDGISVHFYSSDVAGLMSYYYANIIATPAVLIGNRCNYNRSSPIPRRSQAACDDLNAGSFHLIITNKLGLKGVGLIVDIDRYLEVWNHVAVRYETTYRNEIAPVSTSARGTVKRVHVETIVTYAAAIAPKFDPVLNTEAAEYAQQTYEYYLDVNRHGDIIGGDWISDTRPDFVWTQKKSAFLNSWSPLNQIYRPATEI
ncbi:MAG: hypothetical protein H0V66_13785 [Bdellovibrionales bacterium]|nr:hypothetical protein [Bdellovibrionales bacterium]